MKFPTQQTQIRVMGGASARQLQSRCKMYSCFCKSTKMHIQLRVPTYNYNYFSSIVVSDFLPPLVMTSLLEQAPDWFGEYPPTFRFFNSRKWRVKRSIRCVIRAIYAASFAPQDCLSRLCIDLTCKSFARNASFASGVNAPLERHSLSEVMMGRGSPICQRERKKIMECSNKFCVIPLSASSSRNKE